jgi:hypothetical protein
MEYLHRSETRVSTETPTLLDVIQLAIDIDRAHLHVACPGRVESYDPAAQTVVVTPMTKCLSRNADDDRIVDTLPILSAVPVEWPRGGGYFLCMPLVQGDEGTILFTDTDLGAWRDSGQVSDPGDERRHALGGAVFRPGLSSVARVLAGASTGHLVLGKDGGPAVHIDGSTVQLGATGGAALALANASFQSWVSAVSTATGAPAPVGYVAVKVKGT